MKYLLLATFVSLAMPALSQTNPTPVRRTVYADWEFRQAHTDAWKPAKVPASVHTALLENGMIEDPFYRDNEEKLQWIEQEDWEFQCNFDVEESILQHKHVELIFQGLDTYAQVYLNDSLILEADNMFLAWEVDVKKWLKPNGNKLHIYFESPVKKVAQDWKNLGYELPGGIRTMTRKAQFHYGWDWGPRFVGCGILKAPEIRAWDDLLIENIFVTTQSITKEKAKMVARFRYRSDFAGAMTIATQFEKIKSIEDRNFQAGVHEDSVTWEVNDPQLWWCNGLGKPNLYDFTVSFKRGVTTIEKVDVRTGIRTIELVTSKDAAGESFYFKLNGVPVFAKGANYIPQDIFQDRVSPAQYKDLLDDAVASNMNMLRVWGGGIYEDDLFYQLCDARGIMVWQDFMYACAMYPGNGKFLKSCALEAFQQIERLRQHPCMALWCGNNENNEAWHNWGWQMQFNEAQREQVWRDYQLLFNDLLPTYVANYGGGIAYWESSPRYGRANPKSNTEGDSHYWGVWHDEEPFETFNKKVPRFMSEYGFQSFPEWRTIQRFTRPDERLLDSKVMLSHQKHPRGNALIAEYMKRDYRLPKSFEDFVYVSQLLQAEGMRTAVEAHRRNKPYCMGTLYWQLNDVWPVASWSGRDYFGHWKAMQYYMRDAFKPVAALPVVEDDILKIYGVSDLPEAVKVTVRVRAFSLDGKSLSDNTQLDTSIEPDSSRMIWQGYLKSVLDRNKEESSVVEITLKNGEGATLSRRLFYLAPPRKLHLPKTRIHMKVEQVNEGYRISLESDRLAKNVMLSADADGFFSDNYFDMLPGERKTVLFRTNSVLDNPQSAFSLKSLVDTY
ncbi:MAG: glycoside hydrolase family 2 protein [Saprospiraceae bacterium]|nr:glycoside hydrolase family 2 protein [Saprospiraceae bacterium]MCB0575711.1 glycoside hydrolase family 2 protein [Saprospiraceae bacterium]MCB9355469.1 glycoside hydrolase family 2 protein [Lewinellaceae bacterium]